MSLAEPAEALSLYGCDLHYFLTARFARGTEFTETDDFPFAVENPAKGNCSAASLQ